MSFSLALWLYYYPKDIERISTSNYMYNEYKILSEIFTNYKDLNNINIQNEICNKYNLKIDSYKPIEDKYYFIYVLFRLLLEHLGNVDNKRINKIVPSLIHASENYECWLQLINLSKYRFDLIAMYDSGILLKYNENHLDDVIEFIYKYVGEFEESFDHNILPGILNRIIKLNNKKDACKFIYALRFNADDEIRNREDDDNPGIFLDPKYYPELAYELYKMNYYVVDDNFAIEPFKPFMTQKKLIKVAKKYKNLEYLRNYYIQKYNNIYNNWKKNKKLIQSYKYISIYNDNTKTYIICHKIDFMLYSDENIVDVLTYKFKLLVWQYSNKTIISGIKCNFTIIEKYENTHICENEFSLLCKIFIYANSLNYDNIKYKFSYNKCIIKNDKSFNKIVFYIQGSIIVVKYFRIIADITKFINNIPNCKILKISNSITYKLPSTLKKLIIYGYDFNKSKTKFKYVPEKYIDFYNNYIFPHLPDEIEELSIYECDIINNIIYPKHLKIFNFYKKPHNLPKNVIYNKK